MTARASLAARAEALPAAAGAGADLFPARRLRVLMVSARAFPFMGGIETHIHEVAPRLAAAGHDVTVLTTDPSGRLPARESFRGIGIVRVRAWPSRADYYFAPGILREISRGCWDLVHIQGCHTFVAPLAMIAAIRKRLPFVLTFHSGGHSSHLRNAVRRLQWATLAPLLRRAAHLIGVSQYEADRFSRAASIARERFSVIPNGASLPRIVRPDQPKSEGRLIVSIGRLERYKGHQRAITAMPELLRHVPNARLRVLGDGPFEDELAKTARKLGLEHHVTIGGIAAKERARLAELLARADLVVLFSEYEAHPVAVMEAASLGKRVLTSDTSGFGELAARGIVRSIPLASSPAEIAAAMIEELMQGPAVSLQALPSWDDCAERLLAIYNAVSVQGRNT